MNIEPKIEHGSSSTKHVIHAEVGTDVMEPHNLEEMTISDLVEVLRGAYLTETFDRVEAVLMSRDVGLRKQIQHLQHNVEMEKLARLHAEKEFKKREELCQKGKKDQERYEALLKKLKTDLADKDTVVVLRERNIELRKLFEEAKTSALAERVTIGEIRKKNIELECELKKLKEKCVDDRNELEVLRKKNDELDNEVLELKEKRVEDGNAIDDVIKRKNCELEAKVLELENLNEKWLNDRNALGEIRSKLKETVNKNLATINELRNENIKLVDEKRKVEILLESLNTEFRGLHERNARLEDVEASQVDHVANAPVAIPHVSDRTNVSI